MIRGLRQTNRRGSIPDDMKLRRGQRLTIEAVHASDEPAWATTESGQHMLGVEIGVDAEDVLVLYGSEVSSARALTDRELGRLAELRTGIADDLRRLKQLAS